MLPILSICIPTYNRCADLKLLLDSLVLCGEDMVNSGMIEVVISDNASSDNTDIMVQAYTEKIPSLRYLRNALNIGFAGNLNQVVNLGSANYCWLMGSDEKILPSAIKYIVESISENPDIILGNPITNGRERLFLKRRGVSRFKIKSAEEFYSFTSECTEYSAAFAFISTIVIKKSYWCAENLSEIELSHPYTHMLRLTRAISKNDTLILYLDQPLVETGHNINEYNSSVLPHVELDLLTMKYISDVIFCKSEKIFSTYAYMLKNQYKYLDILKSRVESSEQRWRKLQPILNSIGYQKILIQKNIFDPYLFLIYFFIKKIKFKLN